ncbi:hypothetical protein QBC46DRAFT_452693 [Diplogelasinospora grovesii]|uniref:Uncharacterized protein n=1 Tax=Diplogelasinospora grovesii TaxID=303347 RepID=A0AAN6MZQ8_9PEZI|nr:hypothetical protein QBC46DRAFT_452693 [Diplogelasinospora grovesii]
MALSIPIPLFTSSNLKKRRYTEQNYIQMPTTEAKMSGYTDQAVEQGHDLIDRAEEEAHMHDDDWDRQKPAGQEGGQQGIGQKIKKTMGLEGTESSAGTGVTGQQQQQSSSSGGHMGPMEHVKQALHLGKSNK